MRILQVAGFVLGVAAFLAAALYTGTNMGETLWKTGMAVLVSDIVLVLLWPRKP
jgi:hypothetical protein